MPLMLAMLSWSVVPLRCACATLLLAFVAAAGAQAPAPQVQALFDAAAPYAPTTAAGLQARIGVIGAALLGRDYLRDPLGEGASAIIDPDPLFRLDAFDCVTWVETVLALARARSADEVMPQMLALRYTGTQVSYAARNHLPTFDWLPNAVSRGIVQDITAEVFAPQLLAQLPLEIDRAAVLSKLAAGRLSGGSAADPRRTTLRYAPLPVLLAAADAGELEARIADGTVLLVVGPQAPGLLRAGIGEAIYHYGIAAHDVAGLQVFRSATPAGTHTVRDVPLAAYLRHGAREGVMLGLVLLRPLPVR